MTCNVCFGTGVFAYMGKTPLPCYTCTPSTPSPEVPNKYEMLAYELDGVIIDTEENGFDDICLATIKRVRDELKKG